MAGDSQRRRWARREGARLEVEDAAEEETTNPSKTGSTTPVVGDGCLPSVVAEDLPVDRRWGGKTDCRKSSPAAAAPSRVIYTIGTWRVGRELYLWQLQQRGVKQLVDVRGNPQSGREEALFRGKDFTKALAGVGVRYEFWGDRLGEDQLEALNDHELCLILKGMLAAAPAGPLCLLGHMHEPHKCHRLRLCDHLPGDCAVEHLMWLDHQVLQGLGHPEARLKQDSAERYFVAKRAEEEAKRQAERRSLRLQSTPGCAEMDAERQQSLQAAVAAAATATKLPSLVWEECRPAEWEERLRDGKPYRLLLPWDTELLWYPAFLDTAAADELEKQVHSRVTMHHPTYSFQTPSGVLQRTINRKGQAKLCDDFTFSVQYSSRGMEDRASGKLYDTSPLEPWSKALLRRVEAASETVFNAIWFNHYRDGTVTIHWHTDSDEGLGPDPIIGSLSLGAARDFCLKSKRAQQGHGQGLAHVHVPLFHGSLLVMGKNSQRHWLHAVPAMEGVHRERTNLTFRFYAHEDLALVSKGSNSSAIQLTNSKLLLQSGREQQQQQATPAQAASLSRLRLTPKLEDPCLRPILLDLPEPHTTAGALLQQLCDQLLPDFKGQVCLGVPAGAGHRRLDESSELTVQLLQDTADARNPTWAELLLLPLQPLPCVQPQQESLGCRAAQAWPGLLVELGVQEESGDTALRRELELAPPGPYRPPQGLGLVVPASGECWLREVLQSLSGIQRSTRGKGRGRLQHFIFHQSSEFVALYAGRPKSAVHLVVLPKRLLRRGEASVGDAPLLRRLSLYATHLAQHLSAERPGMLWAAGLRLRPGRAQQLHGHLLSMDLAAPSVGDLERRHFEDFTGGADFFLPLQRAAQLLARGQLLPASPLGRAGAALACHRCGHLFGDSVRQLSQHLSRCTSWPSREGTSTCAATEAPLDTATQALLEECAGREVALLEEMGFGFCGQQALREALAAAGNVERAVAVLAAE